MRVGVSIVVPVDVFGLKTHPRYGLRETSQMVRCRLMSKPQQNVLEFSTSCIGRTQGKISPVDRNNMVGIKSGMRLSGILGFKLTLVMEETKSRAASPISVTRWEV